MVNEFIPVVNVQRFLFKLCFKQFCIGCLLKLSLPVKKRIDDSFTIQAECMLSFIVHISIGELEQAKAEASSQTSKISSLEGRQNFWILSKVICHTFTQGTFYY